MPESTDAAVRLYRRNFAVNVGDGAIWQLGMSLTSVAAILPVYVSRLTSSQILIGLIPAIVDMGWFLPQMFTAPLVTRLRRQKPLVALLGIGERLPFLALGIMALVLARAPASVVLPVFFGLLVWRSLASGMVASAWQELIARIIPARRRGRFFGTTATLGGVLSVLGAGAAGELLHRFPYPLNFALCFFTGFAAIAVSWLFLIQTVEPPSAAPLAPAGGSDYWRSLPAILRQDRNFRRYIVTRMVSSLGSMAPGFLAVAAVRRFSLGDEQAGVFSAILYGLGIAANPVWGWLGDRFGHKLTLELCGLLSLASLGFALAAPSAFFFYLAFAALGAANAGYVIATLSIAMEFGAPAQRPTYIGLTNTLRAPVIGLAPLLGGWIAGRFGYPALFGVTMIPVALAVAMLRLTVEEPRKGSPP